jgi:D-alanyl-D-alanine dipeptidase
MNERAVPKKAHDAYRPWCVTRVFWDATPDDKKIFVADPARGSRHNRGAAVDLTLYDLKTGRPVQMAGTCLPFDRINTRCFGEPPCRTGTGK